jgi:hypothetical protein
LGDHTELVSTPTEQIEVQVLTEALDLNRDFFRRFCTFYGKSHLVKY